MKTLIEKLKELDAATTWQPIETAPRDGTKVYGRENEEIFKCHYGEYYRGQFVWFTGKNNCDMNSTPICKKPTHWKPISDDNHSATIKAAIAELEKQARDIEILRGALKLAEDHDKASFNFTGGEKAERASKRGVSRKRKLALEQTGEENAPM